MTKVRFLAITRIVTSPISAAASIAMIALIARSRTKFTTTQNRLLFGLAMSDIISSFAAIFTTIPMPRDTPNVWLALGNTATCELQAFIYLFGGLVTPFYNVALCLFFLLKVRYDVSDEVMKWRVEPFLHGVPILNAFIFCIYCLIKDLFNPAASVCYISDRPRLCSLLPNVPCERGEGFADDWMVKYGVIYIVLVIPFLIFSALTTIYITVRRQEQRMETRYGRGSITTTTMDTDFNTTSPRRSQSHYVNMTMYRALAYSLAWFIPFIGVTIQTWQILVSDMRPSSALQTYNALVYPLQGLFNFIVYIYPKVLHERQMNPRSSLCEVFASLFRTTNS